MKRFFYLMTGILALFIIVGCSSNEKKANKLIDEYMFKHLDDYKSYEAVETKIDTLYNTSLADDICYDAALQMAVHTQNASEYEGLARSAKSVFDVWNEGGRPSSFREQAKNAMLKYYEATKNQVIENREVLNYTKIIVERLPELDGKKQIGWVATHSFRSNNSGGNSSLEARTFFIDKRFKKILRAIDFKDEDVKKAIINLASAKNSPSVAEMDEAINTANALIENLSKSYEEFKAL